MTQETQPEREPQDAEPEVSTANTDRERQARDYESAHNGLFVVRVFITIVALAVYLFSGASVHLADGLAVRFGDHWWWTNAVYMLVTLFAFSALMFPLTLYSDHHLEHRHGLSRQTLNGWFSDYLKELFMELVLTTIFLSAVYVLLRASPDGWWLWTTVLHVCLSVVLSTLWPVLIMPLFHKFEPLEQSELTDAVRQFAEQSGLDVLGVFRWGLEEKTETANAALTGLGKTRRIILGDTMLDKYSTGEIIAVLAHEVGHFRHRDMWRLIGVGTALAATGFYAAHLVLQGLVARFGFHHIGDIGAFPIFIFALFIFSLISMPLSNAYSRRREYAADAYAVKAVGTAEPFIRALQKLADQNLADKEPAPWIEYLLHSHPSINRRIARARAACPAGDQARE